MSLEEMYYVGQTLGVIVIIATLFAVLFQMRQAHRLAKLESSRAIWVDAATRVFAQVEDAEKAEFMQRALFGTDELTDAEKLRFYLSMSSLFTMFENAHAMEKSGLMAEGFWGRIATSMRGYIEPPRARRWWARARKQTFSANPEFAEAVDAILAEADAAKDAGV